MTKDSIQNNVSVALKEGYEAKVVAEALNRAGKNPQLKGIVHEVLFKDSINMNPVNMVKGVNAQLTKSTTAKTVDVVVQKSGKIIERIQLKDTVSSGGLSKTVNQIKNGQYNSAQVLGTKETAAELAKKLTKEGVSKTVKSSGISSETTSRIASKAGVVGKGAPALAATLKSAAKSGGIGGAIVSGGIETVSGIVDLLNGDKDFEEVAVSVVKNTAKGATSAAAASVAATAAGTAVATGVAAVGLTGAAATVAVAAAPVVVALGVGWVVSEIFSAIFD